MTTIAYKDGMIAADTGSWCGEIYDGTCQKLFQHKDHVTGVCGGAADGDAYLEWINAGCPDPRPTYVENLPEVALLRVYYDHRTIHIYEKGARLPVIVQNDIGCAAIGHGREIALGAMHAGASAKEAVEIAAKLDAFTRGPVVSVSLNRSANDEA